MSRVHGDVPAGQGSMPAAREKWGGHQKEALAELWWPPSKEDT